MKIAFSVILCLLTGYLVGSFNLSYVIGRTRGYDIRTVGSGNAGASNALIVMGTKAGVFIALFDIFKTFAVVVIMRCLLGHFFLWAAHVTAGACILGHMFPFYMNFRGGKGLACLGGTILAFDWRFFLGILGIELILVLVLDYICFVPMTASLLFPAIYWITGRDWIGALLLLVPAVCIWIRHLPNLRRIAAGKELHFSYLWKKEKELDRVTREKPGR